jgi:hypothetical protein
MCLSRRPASLLPPLRLRLGYINRGLRYAAVYVGTCFLNPAGGVAGPLSSTAGRINFESWGSLLSRTLEKAPPPLSLTAVLIMEESTYMYKFSTVTANEPELPVGKTQLAGGKGKKDVLANRRYPRA